MKGLNVEIQLENQHNMTQRILYYWSKLYSSSIGTGQDYNHLVPTIMISIINYPLFPHETDSFHNIFHLKEDKENFIWSSHLEIHSIDLSQFMVKWKKYRRELKDTSPSEYPWLMMLSAVNYRNKTINKDIFDELEELAMNEQEVREALMEWENSSANKENKVLYEARLKFLRDQLSNIRGERREGREEGLKEGMEKGMEKGIKEGIRNVAKNLLETGMPIEKITEVTGLSEEEIRGL